MVCFFPGARVQDTLVSLHDIFKGEGEQPNVFVHRGTNYISMERDEILENEYQELGKKLKKGDLWIIPSVLMRVGTGR